MDEVKYPSVCCEAVARYHRNSEGTIYLITCSKCGLPFDVEQENVIQTEPAVGPIKEEDKKTLEQIGDLRGTGIFQRKLPIPKIYAVSYFLYLLLGTACCIVALPFLLVLRLYAGFVLWLQLDIKRAFLKNLQVCAKYMDEKFLTKYNE